MFIYIKDTSQYKNSCPRSYKVFFNFLSSQILQELVIQWSKVAYENIPYKEPDYELDDDGKPRPINQGMSMLKRKFTDLMQGDISEDSIALHID